VALLGFIALGMAGCGAGGPACQPTTGKLTIGGQVPSGVQVSLYPVSGNGPIASGNVDAATGQFTLTTAGRVGKPAGQGAVAGKYKVVLSAGGGSGGPSPEEMMKQYSNVGANKAPATPKASFPKEFGSASTSPKEVEIKSGPNTLDLAL
jgi:hypothetical protein